MKGVLLTEIIKKDLSFMEIYEFDDKYSADNYGNVYFNYDGKYKKIKKGDKVKSFKSRYGYIEYILIDKNGKRKHIQAHRIVACLFIPNTYNKKYVNHIDGDKLNNQIQNLEWVTSSENELHSYKILNKTVWNKGKKLPSGRDYRGKIRKVLQLSLEGETIKEYFNPTEAEKEGFKIKQISAVCKGTQKTHKGFRWKYLEN